MIEGSNGQAIQQQDTLFNRAGSAYWLNWIRLNPRAMLPKLKLNS